MSQVADSSSCKLSCNCEVQLSAGWCRKLADFKEEAVEKVGPQRK